MLPRKTLLKMLLIGAAVGAVWWLGPWRSIAHPPGILISSSPHQIAIPGHSLPDREGWKLRAVAEYEVRGRVLGTKSYYTGASSDLVPTDVAVGWGRMSDTTTLNALSLSMGNRFFFYEWDNQPPLADSEIIRSVANNHVIAANDQVRELISHLRPGHLVHFRGYLVDATKAGEGAWLTSRRRDDRGNGACELFYVEFARAFEVPPEDFTTPPVFTSRAETSAPFAKAAAR